MAIPINIDCVRLSTQFLPNSALEAVVVMLNTAIGNLNAQYAILKSKILTLEFALAPLIAKQAALQSMLDAVYAQFKIIDITLVSQCSTLGDMNKQVLESASQITTAATNTINIINRRLAVKNVVESKLVVVQDGINFLQSLRDTFQSALALRSQVKTAATLPPLQQLTGQLP